MGLYIGLVNWAYFVAKEVNIFKVNEYEGRGYTKLLRAH